MDENREYQVGDLAFYKGLLYSVLHVNGGFDPRVNLGRGEGDVVPSVPVTDANLVYASWPFYVDSRGAKYRLDSISKRFVVERPQLVAKGEVQEPGHFDPTEVCKQWGPLTPIGDEITADWIVGNPNSPEAKKLRNKVAEKRLATGFRSGMLVMVNSTLYRVESVDYQTGILTISSPDGGGVHQASHGLVTPIPSAFNRGEVYQDLEGPVMVIEPIEIDETTWKVRLVDSFGNVFDASAPQLARLYKKRLL